MRYGGGGLPFIWRIGSILDYAAAVCSIGKTRFTDSILYFHASKSNCSRSSSISLLSGPKGVNT